MTRRQLEQLVRLWQHRLALERWQIDVRLDVEAWLEYGNTLGDEAPDASVRHRIRYHQAELYLNPEKSPTWTRHEASQHVAHELLHLVLRPLEQHVETLEPLLHGDVWRVFEQQHERTLELVVDELARRLVELERELT